MYLEDWGVTSALMTSLSSAASALDSQLADVSSALNSSYWLLRTQNAATASGGDPRCAAVVITARCPDIS